MGSKKKNDMKKNKKSKNKNKDVIDNPSLITEKTSISHDRDKKKIITDARFSSVHSDPRFQNVPKHKAKVTIDSRFDRMFSDKSFASSSAPLDKRGKPKKKNSKNLLRHYYKVEEEKEKDENDSEEGEESDSDGIEIEKKNQVLEKPNSSNELEESESESESEDDDDAETGESDYTTDTDEGEMEENYDYETPELPVENIPEIDKETRRLAIVNLDWRHVKAEDLYVVLSSFLPKGGQIISVAVYPSEFGLERMKEEELRGPVGLFDDEQEKNDEHEDEDEDEELDNEKLRAYELSRLRYYYAVVECDSIATADYLYKTCDGVEFERSSNVLDLRFIPDSMEFKHAPRDIATEAPSSYEVLNFHTSALQHSKINLSWDEDEPQRVRALKRKFNEDQLAELEFKEFLASDESESDDGEEDQIDKKCKKGDKYRALLQSDENDKQEDDQDMEVTFNTGLEDISERILAKKDKKSESLWDAYLRKKREKKKAGKNKSTYSSEDESSDTDREVVEQADDFFIEEPSVKSNQKDQSKNIKDKEHVDREAETSRAELELLLADDQGVNTGPKGYNLKQYQKKAKKKGKEDLAEDKIPTVDYDDARFSALFTSPLFALDPTDPQFKRSAAYVRQATLNQPKGSRDELMKSTKQSVFGEDEANNDVPVKTEGSSSKEKLELSSLVKSIKMKSKQLQLPSDGKRSNKDRKQHNRGMEEREGKRESPSTVKLVQKKKRKTRDMAD